eukprot:1183102-Prorocentrum_minimum.AAC.1
MPRRGTDPRGCPPAQAKSVQGLAGGLARGLEQVLRESRGGSERTSSCKTDRLHTDLLREIYGSPTKRDVGFVAKSPKAGLEGVDSRLEGVDSRLEGVDSRLEGVDSRLKGAYVRGEPLRVLQPILPGVPTHSPQPVIQLVIQSVASQPVSHPVSHPVSRQSASQSSSQSSSQSASQGCRPDGAHSPTRAQTTASRSGNLVVSEVRAAMHTVADDR